MSAQVFTTVAAIGIAAAREPPHAGLTTDRDMTNVNNISASPGLRTKYDLSICIYFSRQSHFFGHLKHPTIPTGMKSFKKYLKNIALKHFFGISNGVFLK